MKFTRPGAQKTHVTRRPCQTSVVSLTVGSGPLGTNRAGTFNFDTPEKGAILWDPVPHRIRAIFAKETIVDSTRVKLLHETGHLPVYYFPRDDVRMDLLEPSEKRTRCPYKGEATYWSIRVGGRTARDAVWAYPEPIESSEFLRDHVALYWDELDEWFAEDEQLFGHPRDPYSRIDVYAASRRVHASVDGHTLADSRRAKILFETALPPRWYVPKVDVRMDLLVPTGTATHCPYKGQAQYWSARLGDRLVQDLAWSYRTPLAESQKIAGLVAFYNERVDLFIDGKLQERPATKFSR
jgi:uncharacterized protein (DUF427 family)